jgi:hypothetical protein
MSADAFASTLEIERVDSIEPSPLTGRRRAIHRGLPIAIAASSFVAALGYVLPAHRLNGEGPVHANIADGGVLSLVVLAVVAASVLVLRGRRFGSGMLAGAIAMLGAALALAPVLVTHLIAHVDHAAGQHVFNAGILATFVTGAGLAIGEPLLYRSSRS